MPDVTPGPVGKELEDFPVGSIVMWGSTTTPTGWLLCNGQSITSAVYPALFAVYGLATLPDMRSQVPMGASGGLFGTGGTETVTLTSSQMGIPHHTHSYSDRFPTASNTAAGGDNDASLNLFADHAKTTGGVTEANAASAHNNMQPYLTLNFIIKAF